MNSVLDSIGRFYVSYYIIFKAEGPSKSVLAFLEIIDGPLKVSSEKSAQIGGDVLTMANMVNKAFR